MATVSSICGQERQFPQNNATTISAAINELETLRIVIPFYPTFPPLAVTVTSLVPLPRLMVIPIAVPGVARAVPEVSAAQSGRQPAAAAHSYRIHCPSATCSSMKA